MFKPSVCILPPNTINTVMNTTAINHTVRNILYSMHPKFKRSWDTLHYTPSGTFATVDFTTCPLTVTESVNPLLDTNLWYNNLSVEEKKALSVDIIDNKDIQLLKELIGDYNMSYTVCRIDMPTHKDKFKTGSYRVLLQLSDNSVRICRQNAQHIDTHKGDLFIVDTNRWHSSTTLSGDCFQEYVIIEKDWSSWADIPQELSSIAR